MHVHDIEPQHYNRIVQVRFAGHGFPTVDPDNPMGVMVVFTDAATHEDLEVVIDRPTALALREELDTALSVNDQSTRQRGTNMQTKNTDPTWYQSRANILVLVRHLADEGASAHDIVYAVEKPWKFTEEFHEAEQALAVS